MKLLTKERQKSDESAKLLYIFKKNLTISVIVIKDIEKLETIAIIQVNIEVLHIADVI